jgi:GNAT superfamily N-acetyltransferase
MEIRRINADEWKELRELRLRALKTDPLPFGSTFEETLLRPDTFWQSLADNGSAGSNVTILLACFPKMNGIVRAEKIDSKTFGIYSMWVAPEFRKRGAAAALLLAAEQWAIASGGHFLELFVTDKASKARQLYQSFGFIENGKIESSPHEGQRELGMTKSLKN